LILFQHADQVVKLDQVQHQALKEKLCQALFILPDGYPIIWFSRLVRKSLKARLTGSDLFPILWQRAKQNRQKILVIVCQESLGQKLKQDYDNIAYYAPPFFEINSAIFDNVCQSIVDKIKVFEPLYVIIGIAFPKQECLSLAIHSTLKKQAIPLEWLYRLLQEPGRMWRRYILGAVFLLKLYAKELKKHFFQK